MAPKQLLLEGPAIEPLLEKVWAEHGSDVRIIKAERVRVGGVAGFFAREQFEVTVEVPDQPAAGAPAPRPRTTAAAPAPKDDGAGRARPASGLEALLAAAEEAESGARPAAAPAAAQRGRTSAPSPSPAPPAHDDFGAVFGAVTATAHPSPPRASARPAADDPWVDGPAPGTTPRSHRLVVGRLAEVPEQHQPVPDDDEPAVVTVVPESPLMTDWRAPWETDADLAGAPDEPEAVADAHTADAHTADAHTAVATPSDEHDDDGWADGPALEPAAAGAARPAAASTAATSTAASTATTTLLELPVAPPQISVPGPPPAQQTGLPRRVGRSFAPLPAAPHDDDYSLQRSAVLRLPETDPRLAPLAPLVDALAGGTPWVPELTAPAAAVPAVPSEPSFPAAPHADRTHDHRAADRLAQRLAALGVPLPWLWDLPAGRSAAMRELARRIGSAPVRTRTGPVADPVVVVLADLHDALPVAEHLATGMGLGEEDVVVVGRRVRGVAPERCLSSRQDLQEAAEDARADRRSLVVVLPAPVGAAPPVRAAVADTLEQLAPDEVWAVVDATRRLDDTAAWLAAVAGDRGVDALALTNTDVTSAPAAALALPAPVVLVGDRPATPEAWVSMLAARLAAEELR